MKPRQGGSKNYVGSVDIIVKRHVGDLIVLLPVEERDDVDRSWEKFKKKSIKQLFKKSVFESKRYLERKWKFLCCLSAAFLLDYSEY